MYHFGPRRCVLTRLPALNKTAIRCKRWFQSFGRSNSMQNEIWLRTKRSAGLMPTEARGNYFPDPPYLRETKTYHSQPVDSIRHAGNYFVPLSIGLRPIFIFFVAEVMSNYLTTDGLKKISLLPEAPWGLRPVAFATSACTWLIRHWRSIRRSWC